MKGKRIERSFALLSFFLSFFRIRGTFNTFSAFEYNFPDQRRKTELCTASLSLTRQQCKLSLFGIHPLHTAFSAVVLFRWPHTQRQLAHPCPFPDGRVCEWNTVIKMTMLYWSIKEGCNHSKCIVSNLIRHLMLAFGLQGFRNCLFLFLQAVKL